MLTKHTQVVRTTKRSQRDYHGLPGVYNPSIIYFKPNKANYIKIEPRLSNLWIILAEKGFSRI
jgi:hypothetical protein